MRKLYLHIGRAKTGSSSIQYMLAENRDKLLQEYNIYYPLKTVDKGDKSQVSLSKAFAADDQEFIRKFLDEIHSVDADILLSSEFFYRKDNLCDLFPDFDIRVIVYVRRQDNLLNSTFNQRVKSSRYSKPIDDLYKQNQAGMDYSFVLSKWEARVGLENLTVQAFEKGQMDGGLLKNFLSHIGIDSDEGFKTNKPTSNKSVGRALIHILQNKQASGLKNPSVFKKSVAEAMGICDFPEHKIKQTGVLSPAKRLEILEYYEESNAKVAKRYLQRDDGKLFYEAVPDKDDEWYENGCLDSEEMGALLITVWNQMQEKHGRLSQLNAQELSWKGLLSRVKQRLKRIF